MERGHWGEGCFEYVVVLCLRGIALESSVEVENICNCSSGQMC